MDVFYRQLLLRQETLWSCSATWEFLPNIQQTWAASLPDVLELPLCFRILGHCGWCSSLDSEGNSSSLRFMVSTYTRTLKTCFFKVGCVRTSCMLGKLSTTELYSQHKSLKKIKKKKNVDQLFFFFLISRPSYSDTTWMCSDLISAIFLNHFTI